MPATVCDHTCLTLTPEPDAWRDALAAPGPSPDAEERRALREALGFDTGPIVMTGHQATPWHPGILAKYIAADIAARRFGAQAGHVVVDHDGGAGFETLPVPIRDTDGRLRDRLWRMTGPTDPRRSLVTVPPFVPDPFRPESSRPPVSGAVQGGVDRFGSALLRSVGASSAASQISDAIATMAEPWIGRPASVVRSSELARLGAFQSLVDQMLADPRACVDAYNRAVRAIRPPGLMELFASDVNELYELPLWEIGADGTRRRVFSHEVASLNPNRLAPRAVLLTAFLRMDVCDLFIAGTGAGHERGYERVVERWIAEWLGRSIAPAVVVSADVTLADELGHEATDDDDRARWRAHHARHDPETLADATRAAQKTRLVEAIRDARSRGADPAPLFREMHALLRDMRQEHADTLSTLDAIAERALVRAHNRVALSDRTRPFFFYTDATLNRLRDSVVARFEASA